MTGPGQTATEEILPRLRALLARQFSEAGSAPDDLPLPDALGERYDSLAALEFISAVENEFGIEVDFVADDLRHWFSQLTLAATFVARALEDVAVLGSPSSKERHD